LTALIGQLHSFLADLKPSAHSRIISAAIWLFISMFNEAFNKHLKSEDQRIQ
jgi:hypothetical protein